VFSSNVLEHVVDLEQVLGETLRVLKPGGISIHILPSSSWRWWTLGTYYAYYSERLVKRIATKLGSKNIENMGLRQIAETLLLPKPHGEYSSAVTELYYFSRFRWRKVFEQAGFSVVSERTNSLFYTGYSAFPKIQIQDREKMSKYFGASCNIFVLKRKSDQ
jgi:ubiquinone/menaquinone biosynthesis C-methylase UbiE